MPSKILSGEVQQKIAGKWRVVLTASGISVTDNFYLPKDWRVQAENPYVMPTFTKIAESAQRDLYRY